VYPFTGQGFCSGTLSIHDALRSVPLELLLPQRIMTIIMKYYKHY
jgi:hypothetical protein